jgi:hypothetical protein
VLQRDSIMQVEAVVPGGGVSQIEVVTISDKCLYSSSHNDDKVVIAGLLVEWLTVLGKAVTGRHKHQKEWTMC